MSTKEEQKQHLIDIMKADEELGLYEHGQEVGHSVQVERMYSEEQVIELIQFLSMDKDFNGYGSVYKATASYFLEKFKKQ
jgi:hypothetical protein